MLDRLFARLLPAITWAAVLGLALLAVFLLAALAFRSSLTYQINYNEGWNAYFVQRILSGLPLYPSSSEPIINNYPPVGFYLVAIATGLTGDILNAGRLVSWIGFLGCAACIAYVLARMRCQILGVLAGTAVWAALMTIRFDLYVGMFDPQITAHFIMLGGLCVLLTNPTGSQVRSFCSAALVVTACATKHNILALPITIVAWLALYHRRALVSWLCWAVSVGILELALFRLAFGPDLVAGITSARRYAISNSYTKMVNWIIPIAPLVGMATLPVFTIRRDRFAVFIAIYLASALAIGCLGAAGDGTNYNVIFDVAIATALGIGYLVGHPASCEAPSNGDMRQGLSAWSMMVGAVCLLLAAMQVADATTTNLRRWIAREHMREANAEMAVRFIASQPGPAICELLLLCFWAEKPFTLDAFNFGQAVLMGTRDPGRLIDDISRHHYAAIQANLDQSFLPATVIAAISEHYRPAPGMADILVPKTSATRNQGSVGK